MKPEMRHQLAQLPFEEKIAKVGELIRLRQKIKTDVSKEEALLATLDRAAAELDAGNGVPIEASARKSVDGPIPRASNPTISARRSPLD